MKRFYTEVSVAFADPLEEADQAKRAAMARGNAWRVLLDSKPIKTPRRAVLSLPNMALAEAVAEEWRSQTDVIKPLTMPLTKLANTAIDRVVAHRFDIAEKITFYANDQLCYRAAAPEELVERQSAAWDPLLDWAAERFGARLATGAGLRHIAQPVGAVAALRAAVARYDSFVLTGLHNAVTILGSLVLGLALAEGRLDAEAAFVLSQLDELYQAENWGKDIEADTRAHALAAELAAAARFMKLAGSSPV
jgi:chaperone required for assembly of F1-ATPase